jgi:hypothetical protein
MKPVLRRPRGIYVAILVVAASVSVAGCGHRPGYPTAKAVSVLGRPGECAYCHRKIEKVAPENLMVYDGVQYIVCDEKCAAAQRIAADR